MSACEGTDKRSQQSVRNMLDILKKYSLAAGDRNQWMKVEAMLGGKERAEVKAASFGCEPCHVTIV
jgi:hypothetical protein